MQYDNRNTGALFKNDSDNPKAPVYKGPLNVEGKEFKVAAWLRESKNGTKFLSLAVEPAEQKSAPPQQQQQFAPAEDIPF